MKAVYMYEIPGQSRESCVGLGRDYAVMFEDGTCGRVTRPSPEYDQAQEEVVQYASARQAEEKRWSFLA